MNDDILNPLAFHRTSSLMSREAFSFSGIQVYQRMQKEQWTDHRERARFRAERTFQI
jgi:hypothetical protein